MAKKRFARLPAPPAWHHELTTVGVTGTNGKTSTTLLIGGALAALASPAAQVTTVGSFLDCERFETSFDYQGFIATMAAARERGGKFAAIELTSEALALGFGKAWPCRVGVFTNPTRDHLDSHGSAEHYLASKAQLFMQLPQGGVAVLNSADPAAELLAEVVPKHARILRYAIPSRGPTEGADLVGVETRVGWDGTAVTIAGEDMPSELRIAAVGEVFAENGLAALGAAVGIHRLDRLRPLAQGVPCGQRQQHAVDDARQVLGRDQPEGLPRIVLDGTDTCPIAGLGEE